ncbi:zinc finger BED domain-containing protein RICESLEEPER 2-like [Olea europaea var. sylvestris]|uniref:zinc finger BED domain-containing protein RICESLEEPER 2-like n=1 Tax=Olea europaea var. sylvestris TaxID=158386 RepID=UPI000C1D7E92|nr:zinc finger BED domain-containing protein RICESLEEPER 2-like [Olea europaea var. sylvestris]
MAIIYVKNKLKNWKADCMILRGAYLHVRCSVHIINLIVNDGLKEFNHSIASIRNAIKNFRSSPSRHMKFKACIEREKIGCKKLAILDVPTIWNSTFLMLGSALNFQKAFERMEEEDGFYYKYFDERENGHEREGPPTSDDWDEVKFDKYWGTIEKINKLLLLAIVLDPRYKFEYVAYCASILYNENKVDVLKSEVMKMLYALYNEYKGRHGIDDGIGGHNSNNGLTSVDGSDDDEDGDRDDMSPFNKVDIGYKKLKTSNVDLPGKDEIQKYLGESIEDPTNENFDILYWWKINSESFSTLSEIARDVLVIPVSTVASESAFSPSGQILDSFRSSLTPKTVEALICTQNWLRGESGLLKPMHINLKGILNLGPLSVFSGAMVKGYRLWNTEEMSRTEHVVRETEIEVEQVNTDNLHADQIVNSDVQAQNNDENHQSEFDLEGFIENEPASFKDAMSSKDSKH